MELMMMRKSFEKELSELHENIQLREEQRIKLISSIESLVEKRKLTERKQTIKRNNRKKQLKPKFTKPVQKTISRP